MVVTMSRALANHYGDYVSARSQRRAAKFLFPFDYLRMPKLGHQHSGDGVSYKQNQPVHSAN